MIEQRYENEEVVIFSDHTGREMYRGVVALAYRTEKKGHDVWYVAFDAMSCQYLSARDTRVERPTHPDAPAAPVA